jgi:hypothetical protein
VRPGGAAALQSTGARRERERWAATESAGTWSSRTGSLIGSCPNGSATDVGYDMWDRPLNSRLTPELLNLLRPAPEVALT